MAETFESLLVRLSRAGVDYLVAGGVAVCLNGYVRTTQDIDLLVDASPGNLQRLLDCLADFGQGFSRELSPADFPLEGGALRIVEDFTVDVFTLLRDRTFADFSVTARSLEVGGTAIRSLAPEGLIELKAASARRTSSMSPRCGACSRATRVTRSICKSSLRPTQHQTSRSKDRRAAAV